MTLCDVMRLLRFATGSESFVVPSASIVHVCVHSSVPSCSTHFYFIHQRKWRRRNHEFLLFYHRLFFFFWILLPVLPELRDSRSTDLTMRTPTQLLVTFLLFSFFDGNYHRFLTCCCFLIWRMDDTGGQCRDQSNYCGLVQTLELCYIPRYRQHCCQTCQNHPSQIVKEDRTISNSRTDKKSTTKKKKKKIKKIKKVQIPTNSSVSAAAARL